MNTKPLAKVKRKLPLAPVGRWGAREEGILDVARALFAKDGYDNVTMAAVAKAAGLSEGTLYNYFRDKRDLVIQVGSVGLEKRTQEIESAIQMARSFDVAFHKLLVGHLRTIVGSKHIYRIWMREVRAADAYDRSQSRDLLRRYTNLFLGLLERWNVAIDTGHGLTPAMMRDLVLGGVEHVAWTAIVQGREADLDVERTADDLVKAYLRAFCLTAGGARA